MPQELPRGIDDVSVHPDINDDRERDWVAYGYGEYEDSSVLAGQDRRVWLGRYATKEEALSDWPMAMAWDNPAPKPSATMPTSAPSWFDPADAGEAWGEDDY